MRQQNGTKLFKGGSSSEIIYRSDADSLLACKQLFFILTFDLFYRRILALTKCIIE